MTSSKHRSKVQIILQNMDTGFKCKLKSFALDSVQGNCFWDDNFCEMAKVESREAIVVVLYTGD